MICRIFANMIYNLWNSFIAHLPTRMSSMDLLIAICRAIGNFDCCAALRANKNLFIKDGMNNLKHSLLITNCSRFSRDVAGFHCRNFPRLFTYERRRRRAFTDIRRIIHIRGMLPSRR